VQAQAMFDQVGDRPEDDAEQGGDHDPGQHPADFPAEQQNRGGGQDHSDGHGDGADRDAFALGWHERTSTRLRTRKKAIHRGRP
jgi:hypothetical protein